MHRFSGDLAPESVRSAQLVAGRQVGRLCWPRRADRRRSASSFGIAVGGRSSSGVKTQAQNDVVMARLLVAHAVVVAAMLCVAGGDLSSSTPTSPTPGGVVDSAGCPVEDEVFCDVATEVANALAAGDDEALLELSRVDMIVCDDVVPEYFPECEPSATLHGYGLSGPYFLVHLVNENAFVDHLRTITGRVDRSFSDEHGDGAVRIIGVGTRPGRTRPAHVPPRLDSRSSPG